MVELQREDSNQIPASRTPLIIDSVLMTLFSAGALAPVLGSLGVIQFSWKRSAEALPILAIASVLASTTLALRNIKLGRIRLGVLAAAPAIVFGVGHAIRFLK